MISGCVDERLQAVIELDIVGPSGTRRVNAVIDTGFNGFLSLEGRITRALGLKSVCVTEGTLANGTVVDFETCLGKTIWHGLDRPITIVESGGGNLLGMEMLKGSRLTIDVAQNGTVTVTLLPEP